MAKRDIFHRIKNYTVYYGSARELSLSGVDVAIVEPTGQTRETIRAMQDQGILVIGYVSVMEAGPHQELYDQLEEADFLHTEDGERIPKVEYGNFVLDMTSAHWRGILLYEIGRLLAEQGYDGVFLDTIGNVELHRLPDQSRQLQSAVDLVAQLRKWFPQSILIQNNGLELLAPRTASYVDGIVWENPPLSAKDSAEWVQLIGKRLSKLAEDNQLKVMILFDGTEEMSRQAWIIGRSFADQHGFVPSFSPRHYMGPAVSEIRQTDRPSWRH